MKRLSNSIFQIKVSMRQMAAIILFTIAFSILGVTAYMQRSPAQQEQSPTEPAKRVEKRAIIQTDAKDESAASEQPDANISGGPLVASSGNYSFSTATNASLTDMSSGTTQLVAASQDDTASAATSIGFDFYFQGAQFSQFSVSSNGGLRLGGTVISSTTYGTSFPVASQSILAPFLGDHITSSTGKVHYKVTGSAPNRVLVVEWLNMGQNWASTTADGTYQVRLYETTGVIEYVYGAMAINGTSTSGGGQVDVVGFASTTGDNNFITVNQSTNVANTTGTAATSTYSATGPIANLTSATNGSRRIYTFTPPTLTAPTNLTFTSLAPSSYTLNWTDSPNEQLYAVYRSTDGTNYSFISTVAAGTTTFNATGLTPSTTYFWRVFAVSEGALSTALTGSQATSAPATITSNAVTGNWSATSTWSGGVVPTANDNVIIANGATVTIDVAANCFNLTVGQGTSGILQYEQTTARTLTAGADVTIASGGTFRSNTAGTVTTHNLSIGGSLTNSGTLNFNAIAGTGAQITFTGSADASFTLNAGSTTNLRTTTGVTLNKGTSNTPVLTFTPGGTFTVQGANTTGFLSISNGTFKISGTNTFSNPVFNAAGYTIPATGGFWLNNANATVVAQSSSPIQNGLLRITSGIFNVGTASGNSIEASAAGSVFTIEGGTVNVAGRLGTGSTARAGTYTQTGGTVNLSTIGNASGTVYSFTLGNGSSFNMSAGTINLVQINSNATASSRKDWGAFGTPTITGGTVNLGTGATTGNSGDFTYRIGGLVPNLVINNTTNNKAATLVNQVNALGDTTVSTGTTLTINGFLYIEFGTNFVNNGTVVGSAASSGLYFAGSSAQVYSGTGVCGTNAAPLLSLLIDTAGLTIQSSVTNNIITTNPVIFTGSVTNSNKLTLGNGSSNVTVQIGNTTTPTNAGSFDVSPTFNLGTGVEFISYLRTTNARTTGFEINPTRTVSSITYDDNDSTHTLTIAGGDLTLSNTATALTMTNGRIVTGSNTLILSSGTATVTRTNGYVDGNFRKSFTATGAKTFEVGTANGYSPVAVNATAGTFPANFIVKATQGAAPYVSGTNKLARFWTLTGTGITANLTFNYLASDVTGTVANYKFIKNSGGTLSILNPTGTPTTTSAIINGVSSFSDWTLAEATAVVPGSLQLSSATYSVSESGPSIIVPVTRTGGGDGAVSVSYSTTNGTATAGSDYTATSGTLNWASGDTADKNITIPITDDGTYEGNEDFTVSISAPTGGASLGSPGTATVTINENETAPTISIDSVTVNESAGNAVFTVTQSAVSGLNTTFQYSTANVTATAGSDYTGANNAPGSIAAGSNTTTISIPIADDSTYEGSETFTVTLSNPANATIASGQGTGTGTITDNDTQPAFSITDLSQTEGDTGTTNFDFTVTKTGATELSSSVDFATVDGTATVGNNDYQAKNDTLNFAAGETTKTVTILVNGDTAFEPNETFTVHLSNPLGATITDEDGTGTIQNDDVQLADLSVNMTDAPDPVTVDNNLTYTITVHNSGPDTATGVTLTDTLPANVNFVAADSGCNEASGIVTCSIGSLSNGSDAIHHLTVAPTASASNTTITNNASVTATEADPTTPNTASAQTSVVPAECVTAPAGMVSWYSAGNSPNDIYGMNNGAEQNGVAYSQGKVGQAFSFDGVDDYVEITDNPTLTTSTAITLDAWVKPNAIGLHTIVSKYSQDDASWALLDQGTGRLRFEVRQDGPGAITRGLDTDSPVLTVGVWQHVAATFDVATQAMKIYVNGVEAPSTLVFNTGTISSIFDSNSPVRIGNLQTGDGNLNYFWSGLIDEVEIFNRALSDTEVAGIYNASTAGKCRTSTLQFQSATYSAGEGDGNATITVTRTGAHDAQATVDYATSDGTATAGSDYTATSGMLTFAPGEVSKNFEIPLADDAIDEADETVNLQLLNATGTGASLGTQSTSVLTILDNDGVPTISIGDVTQAEGNSGTSSFNFAVTLSHPSSSNVTFHYSTADGTATAPFDYTAVADDTLTITAGQTTGTISISVNGDTTYETNETFTVTLSNPTNATIASGQGTGTGTIQNDDNAPTTLVVNTTDDIDDGFCLPSHCSLREAINAANANTDASTISFNIPGAGVRTLMPNSALPFVTQPVLINGYSQPGAQENTLANGSNATLLIELDGENAGSPVSGLLLAGANSTVQGLVINRFTEGGILLGGVGGHTVRGNYIGVNPAGTVAQPNSIHGVGVGNSANNTIGGTAPGDRNLISGNGSNGIDFGGSDSHHNQVLGNLIGTDAAGTTDLGNSGSGVTIGSGAHDNQIGGTASGARNIISGNNVVGVRIVDDNTSNNTVQGNFIGTDVSGTGALGNGNEGVRIEGTTGTTGNVIGGASAGAGNTIANNGQTGVAVSGSGTINNSIRGNSIYANQALGIDLGSNGITANDAADADTGANNLQNYPIITSATVTGSTRNITGTLNSTPGQTFTIDFYSNASCDGSSPNDYGEGQTYLGSLTTAATDANGDVAFTFHPSTLTAGAVITATATDSSGNTSEFSQCFAVAAGAPGQIQFSSPTYTVSESGTNALVTVKRVGGSDGSVSATFSTSDGTATAGSDYTTTNTTVTFVDGDAADQTVQIPINNDSTYEGNETVNLSLSTTSVNLPNRNSITLPPVGTLNAVLTITEDDSAPSFSIDNVTQAEGNSSTTDFTFTITKTGTTIFNASVDYATVNGTATAPSDYTAISTTTVTFAPSETTKTVTVQVNGDTVFEPTETFTLHLSNADGATIGQADGTGTITNDDSPSISGHLNYGDGSTGVSNVTMTLTGTNGFTTRTTTTDSNGDYTFSSVPVGNDYTVTPSKTGDVNNVDSNDATMVLQSIVGSTTLSSNQQIAADVDNDGQVFSHDATLILQTIVGTPNSGQSETWKFNAPSRSYPNLSGDQVNQNFAAILLGDVNGNWTPPSGPIAPGVTQPSAAAATATVGRSSSDAGATVNSSAAVIPVSLPVKQDPQTATSTIAINVGDLTGQGVTDYQFNVKYNPTVLTPQSPAFDKTGTLSDTPGGMTIVSNVTLTPMGDTVLRVAASGTSVLTGQGILLKLKFTVIGTPGSTSQLNWLTFTDATNVTRPGFQFNTGTPPVSTVNGQFTVAGPTAAPGTITGRITDENGKAVAGAVVRLSGAQMRKTITDANGNYQFDNVEAAGFYTVTPSRANYVFSPALRSFNQQGQKTEAAFAAAFIGDGANPLDTAEYFVRQSYLDFLSREPDEGGLGYWSDQLIACGNDADCVRSRRIGVAAAFFIEQEFQQSGSFIYNVYAASVGRRPAFTEYAADRQHVVGGANLENEKAAFTASFVERAEFANRYAGMNTPEAFVDALLETVRQSSGVDLMGQRQNLIARYNTAASQNQARASVLRAVAENGSFARANYNSAFVLAEYFGYLRRDPDEGGYRFWLNVLDNREPGNYRGMVCSFITSAEYQKRFSSVVSHINAECGQ